MDFAAHFGLSHIEPMAERIFRAKAHNGLTVCLKIYPNLIHFERSVGITQILNHAAAPVPALLNWAQDGLHGATLQTWWDGTNGEAIFDQLGRNAQHQALHHIGATLGLIQQILPSDLLLPTGFWHRLGINSAEQYTWRAYLGAIVDANIKRLLETRNTSDITKVIHTIQQFLVTVPEPHSLGIIHGDFVLRNIVFRRDLASIAGIIDWDVALLGDPVYDLAKITWADLDPTDAASRQALLQGWQKSTGWEMDPIIFAYYEAIQAIAALAWISKQSPTTSNLEYFRQRALRTLNHTRQYI